MKAVWYEEFGPASDVLIYGERPDPLPQAGEVLVRLEASGVNPSDVKKRAGSFADQLDQCYVIPHSDGAGVIEAVGNGVDQSRIGERVWIHQAQHNCRFGTAAERVAVPSVRAPRLPEQVSFEIGAGLGIPAMTAHRCVFADGDPRGSTIVITGGAGRVGHYAIQWASQAFARVIATASTPADEHACLEAGATAVVNHRDSQWGQRVLDVTGGRKVDRVIDVEFGQNLPEILNVVRTSGVIATFGSSHTPEPVLPFYRMMYQDLTVRMVIVYAMPEAAKAQAIADINDALREGRLQHRIAKVFPLQDCGGAHQMVEQSRVRGAVLVDTKTG